VVGAGVYHPEAAALQLVREAIVGDPRGWKRVSRIGLEDWDDSLKRAPRGFDQAHPQVEDLKRKTMCATVSFSEAEACADGFNTAFLRACRRAAPLVAFLRDAVRA
jgi:uncharacterized protein (DUF2461 family)